MSQVGDEVSGVVRSVVPSEVSSTVSKEHKVYYQR